MEIIKLIISIIIVSILLSSLACSQVGKGDKESGGSVSNGGSQGEHESTVGNVSLKIYSDPSNAIVFVNNNLKGYTPLFISSIPGGRYYTIEIKKEGYETYRVLYLLSKNSEINKSLRSAYTGLQNAEKSNNVSKNTTILDKTDLNKSGSSLWPNSSPQDIASLSLLIALISLLIGPSILIRINKYRKTRQQEKIKKSDNRKAYLSADLEKKERDCITIKITNKGMGEARNYCITFTGNTKEEDDIRKILNQTGYVIPAKESISIPIECDNWIKVCAEMKWDDDSATNNLAKMCFPLKPL